MTTSAILALATGLPLIATNHSGFPDQVLPGKNGYLANEADPEDLAAKILELITQAPRWAEMSRVARAHAHDLYDQKVLMDRQLEHYKRIVPNVKKVAFVTAEFPVVSLTWLISQVADLIDRGIEVEIFNLHDGEKDHVSDRYHKYHMDTLTHSLEVPTGFFSRITKALPKIGRLAMKDPRALTRALNMFKYGSSAWSLKTVFWAEPFLGADFDLVHCHFGPTANKYLIVKEILGLKQKFVVSFYGYDVSSVFQEKGVHYYDRLQKEAEQFLVMSQNMKDRIVATGFHPEKIAILPISIDVESVPFTERSLKEGETIHMATVGRFVEKKGFDDLLRALALLKKQSRRKFRCHIIGGGELENELRALAKELDVEDVVLWKGYMKLEDIEQYLLTMHFYVQPSKTAANGDME